MSKLSPQQGHSLASPQPPAVSYAVGIDVGCEQCSFCILKPDKGPVLRPADFLNQANGFANLDQRLQTLAVPPAQILVGMEWKLPPATGRVCITICKGKATE